MNSLAFLVMLGAFALVLGWYVTNHERDADGREGLLGVRTKEDGEEGEEATAQSAPHRGRRHAASQRRPEEGSKAGTKASPATIRAKAAQDPAARVRARAAALRKRETGRRR